MSRKTFPFLLPFRCLTFILIFVIASAVTNKAPDEISNIWSVVASAVNIITIIILVLISRKNGGYANLINYGKGRTKPKQVVGMVFLILLIGMCGM